LSNKENQLLLAGIVLLVALSLLKFNYYGTESHFSAVDKEVDFYGYKDFSTQYNSQYSKDKIMAYEMKFWSIR
jgi:hypothetical protein